jgi:hypothetical protein
MAQHRLPQGFAQYTMGNTHAADMLRQPQHRDVTAQQEKVCSGLWETTLKGFEPRGLHPERSDRGAKPYKPVRIEDPWRWARCVSAWTQHL